MVPSHRSKLLTLARDLRRRKARERQGLFVAEGVRTVEELLSSPLKVRGVLVTAQVGDVPRGTALKERVGQTAIPVDEVSPAEFDSAAETDSPQGVLAIAEVPESSLAALPRTESVRLLVLDAVQDPGNVGTIVRTAAAFGVSATFSLPGTVDLWNAKVVRSGMGAHFHHPCVSGTWDDLDSFLRERAIDVWAADASGESVDGMKPPPRLAIVVGNEGAGLSSQSRARADRLVALPIAGVESLNVAVAAGILLYELRR
ncbi:MAG TPA: RNA methyltransferase [Gemmatimonadaceae bacterium]